MRGSWTTRLTVALGAWLAAASSAQGAPGPAPAHVTPSDPTAAEPSGPDAGEDPEMAAVGRLHGTWVQFLGWLPNASGYVYRLVTLAPGTFQRSVEERLIRVPPRGKPRKAPLPRGGAAAFCQRARCVGQPTSRTRIDPQTLVFPLADGRRIRFAVVVADRLHYRIDLETADNRAVLGEGDFDDIYLATDAHVFVSPKTSAAAVIVYGQDAVRVSGEVHFVRLPPAPAGLAADAPPPEPAAPVVAAPPPGPGGWTPSLPPMRDDPDAVPLPRDLPTPRRDRDWTVSPPE